MLLGVSAVSCVTIMSPEPFKTMLWAWVESGVTNIDSELPQWNYSCSKLKILWRSVSMINNNKCAINTTVDTAFNVNLFMQFCLLDWRFFLCFSGMFISPGCRPSVSPCLCRDRPLTDITITSISNMPQLDCSCQLWLNSGLDPLPRRKQHQQHYFLTKIHNKPPGCGGPWTLKCLMITKSLADVSEINARKKHNINHPKSEHRFKPILNTA